MEEKILYAVKIGKPAYMEEVITTNPERIEEGKKWAIANGFDRLRIVAIDMSEKPDFTKTINR